MTNAGRGCMDSWGNGAIVWRHNTSLNCLVTSHGVTHSGGPQNIELYDNVLAVDAGAASGFEDGYYRSADPAVAGYDTDLGRCDGTSPLDGNRAPASTYFGYPCWRQPGRRGPHPGRARLLQRGLGLGPDVAQRPVQRLPRHRLRHAGQPSHDVRDQYARDRRRRGILCD
jgi:hypothetical protein